MTKYKRCAAAGIFLCLVGAAVHAQQKPAFSRDEFVRFLVESKKHTYASQGDNATVKNPLLPGSHQLEYSAGQFLYRDIYVGESTFAGQEIVYYAGKPVWTMSYAGDIPSRVGAKDKDAVVKLLHLALVRVPPDEPYRGPRRVAEGAYTYTCRSQGTLGAFFGREVIARGDDELYELRFGGGFLR